MAPGLSRDSYSRISQIFFERFNVAGFSILPRPMAQLYAANALNGVVVDIGYDRTDVTPIYEGFMDDRARTATSLGIKDCQAYLAQLLRANQSVMAAILPADAETVEQALLELAKKVWEDGLVKVPSDGQTVEVVEDDGVLDIAAIVVAGREKAVIEANTKKKMTTKEQARAKEVLDLVKIEFRGHSITLGKERHRFCEPLFDPSLLRGLKQIEDEETKSVQDAVGHAVTLIEVDLRQYIWAGLFVTGELTNHVKGMASLYFKCITEPTLFAAGIGTALQSRLAPYILSNPDQQNDVQTRYIRVLTVPEYFAEYREKGENLAAFLGSSIVAKVSCNFSSCHMHTKLINFRRLSMTLTAKISCPRQITWSWAPGRSSKCPHPCCKMTLLFHSKFGGFIPVPITITQMFGSFSGRNLIYLQRLPNNKMVPDKRYKCPRNCLNWHFSPQDRSNYTDM